MTRITPFMKSPDHTFYEYITIAYRMAKNIYNRQKSDAYFKWMKVASYVGVFLGLVLLAIFLYFEFFAKDTVTPPPVELGAVAPGAVNATSPPKEPSEEQMEEAVLPEDDPGVHRGVISSGETAGELLQEWLPSGEVRSLVNACQNVYSLTRLRAGQPYIVYKDEGEFSRFEYEIDDNNRLVVCREDANWVATVEPIEYDVLLEKVEGTIDSSLFDTMSNIGETPVLAVRIADIFAWEINFIRDIKQGDSFRALVEKRYRDGEFKGYGKMLIAEFVNQGSKFEAFVYTDSFGNVTYFNSAGDSLKRAFLKAPLSFTRVSSGFNLKRLHPIMNTVRPHPAVDYAAPSGTPVKAIGGGVVDFKGWGKGAGNYISLKHSGGYESMYLHLSGFAKGLQKGGKVRQGEVIGYVGSTGYSTGPHLDFRMKRNGQFINPEKTLSPRDESVPAKKLEQFKKDRDLYRLYLDGKKDLTEYTLEKEKLLP